MFQSNGALVKSTTTLWEGPVRDWPGMSGLNSLGLRWSSYAEMYRCQLWVHIAVDKRAEAAARLPFKVYDRSSEGRTSATDTPFGQLMARPSKHLDPFTFWRWTVSTKDIYGEAPWLKERDNGGRPIELHPVHPTSLVSETDQNGVTTWLIRLPRGDIHVKREDLVLHREFNPDSLARGMSTLEPLRSTLENETGSQRANSALWRNGGRPSIILEHPSLLNDGAIKRLSAQWADIHGGVDNWQKAAILEEGMKANVVPFNVGELQYVESRKLNREEVAAAFDLPQASIGILDHATFSNITEQMRSMYRDTMGAVLGALESTVEFELRDGRFGRDQPPDFNDSVYGEFLLDEVLRGAFEARAAAYQQADYMTIAEKRERENLPHIDGTDFVFLNSATLPLGPHGLMTPPGGGGDDPGGDPEAVALTLQKIYLAVGVVISADEARALLNQMGAGLTGPAPTKHTAPPVLALDAPAAPEKTITVNASSLTGKVDPRTADRIVEVIAAAQRRVASLDTVRAVMGRLTRTKNLAEIDVDRLVAGIDADAVPILQQLIAARLAGETIDQFKGRLRALTAKET
jgi:HK97 family phage portal protein